MEATDYNFYNGGRNEAEQVPQFSKPINSTYVTELDLIKEVANQINDMSKDTEKLQGL